MHVGARRLGSVGLPALYWNFIPLPTGAASRAKGSSTVGASLFLLVVLSSKIRGFWGVLRRSWCGFAVLVGCGGLARWCGLMLGGGVVVG